MHTTSKDTAAMSEQIIAKCTVNCDGDGFELNFLV